MRNGVGADFSRTRLVGSVFQYLNLVQFTSDGIGTAQDQTGPGRYKRYAVFDNRSLATDVPTTSVGYSTMIGGMGSGCQEHVLQSDGTVAESIDFASKTFSWRYSLGAGALGLDLRFDGVIDAGNRIRGSIYQVRFGQFYPIGDFQGHLFGPNAREFGLVWNFSQGQASQNNNERGYIVGMRTP